MAKKRYNLYWVLSILQEGSEKSTFELSPSQLDIDHLQNDGVHTYKDNDHAASNEREPPFK